MRKSVITFIGLIIGTSIYAQTENLSETPVLTEGFRFKQSQGDNSLELAMNPFNSGAVFEVPFGFGIRYRKFLSESTAFRLGADISFSNINIITQQADDNVGALELRSKLNSFGLTLRPGFEKHLLSSSRLSPYFGGELILKWDTSKEISQRQAGQNIEERILKNASVMDGFTFGIGGLAGVDFYIAKQLYLGLELNYGFTYFSSSDLTITDFDGSIDIYKQGSAFAFAPQAFSSFRIGYLF